MTNGEAKRCPICNRLTGYSVLLRNADTKEEKEWRHCQCGVAINENPLEFDGTREFENKDVKEYELKAVRAVELYAPLLEDIGSGRKILVVGNNDTVDTFTDRGWVVTTQEFSEFASDEYNGDLVDAVWLEEVFQYFTDPYFILDKIYKITQHQASIVVTSPDLNFIHERGLQNFPHWDKRASVIWKRETLCKFIERCGFEIIMSRGNYVPRYLSWFNSHIIAQKIF